MILMSLLWLFFPVQQVDNVYDGAHFFGGVFCCPFFVVLSSNRPFVYPTKWHCFIGQRDKWQLSMLIIHFPHNFCHSFGQADIVAMVISLLSFGIDLFLHPLMSHSVLFNLCCTQCAFSSSVWMKYQNTIDSFCKQCLLNKQHMLTFRFTCNFKVVYLYDVVWK